MKETTQNGQDLSKNLSLRETELSQLKSELLTTKDTKEKEIAVINSTFQHKMEEIMQNKLAIEIEKAKMESELKDQVAKL